MIFLSQVKQIWQHLAATDTFLSQDDSIAPSPRAKLRIAILSLVQAMVPWFHGAELVSRFLRRNPRFSRKTHDLHRFAGSKWFKTHSFSSHQNPPWTQEISPSCCRCEVPTAPDVMELPPRPELGALQIASQVEMWISG